MHLFKILKKTNQIFLWNATAVSIVSRKAACPTTTGNRGESVPWAPVCFKEISRKFLQHRCFSFTAEYHSRFLCAGLLINGTSQQTTSSSVVEALSKSANLCHKVPFSELLWNCTTCVSRPPRVCACVWSSCEIINLRGKIHVALVFVSPRVIRPEHGEDRNRYEYISEVFIRA